MYVSGVLFNIGTLACARHRWIVIALQLNPAALYITLMRNALLVTQRESAAGLEAVQRPAVRRNGRTLGHEAGAPAQQSRCKAPTATTYANPDHFWYYAIGWAAVAIVVGFFFFWRAEAKYGRG